MYIKASTQDHDKNIHVQSRAWRFALQCNSTIVSRALTTTNLKTDMIVHWNMIGCYGYHYLRRHCTFFLERKKKNLRENPNWGRCIAGCSSIIILWRRVSLIQMSCSQFRYCFLSLSQDWLNTISTFLADSFHIPWI